MSKKDDLVTAVDGTLQPSSDCRKIKGVYYLIGDINIENSGHCYYIPEREKYFRYDTGYIAYDHNLKRYNLKSMINIENGVVGINGQEVIFGSFSTPVFYEHIYLNYKGNLYPCLNREIFKDSFWYKEDLGDGIYYHRQARKVSNFLMPQPCNNSYKNSLQYDCKNQIKNSVDIYNKLNEDLLETTPYSKVLSYGDFIKNYTFGFEFETIKGSVPKDISNKLGLIPVRDGSISGLEYVTIPLAGKKGLCSLVDSVNELKKRTVYDRSCSIHLHIGSIPRTEEYILALFKTLCLIEDKMFDLFPIYKKVNYGLKRKAYTKPFPMNQTLWLMDPKINKDNIKSNFNILFNYLSMGHNYSEYDYDLNNVKSHPSDPGGNGKWHIKTRYHWVNLIPLLFGNKQTIEFRLHTPTYDVNKIMSYLIICVSILDFVIKNQNALLSNFKNFVNLSLFDIIYNNVSYSRDLQFDISTYLNNRKNYIYNCIKKGDLEADEDNLEYNFDKTIDWSFNKNEKVEKKPLRKKSAPLHFYNGEGDINEAIMHVFQEEIPEDAFLEPDPNF